MMLGRRKFLQALGAAPVAAPLVAKKAIEDQAANLAHIGMLGNPIESGPPVLGGSSTSEMFKRACLLGFRKQLEAAIYEEEKHVGYIDHDIAILRSVSQSAKIAYQRKRNVERKIEQMLTGKYSWDKLENLLKELLSV